MSRTEEGRNSGGVGAVAGRELDAAIAERVMGWPVERQPGGSPWLVARGGNRWDRIEEHPFSTNPTAALQAIDQLGGLIDIRRLAPDDWRVSINEQTWWAETLPLAICRAALAAVAPPVDAEPQP